MLQTQGGGWGCKGPLSLADTGHGNADVPRMFYRLYVGSHIWVFAREAGGLYSAWFPFTNWLLPSKQELKNLFCPDKKNDTIEKLHHSKESKREAATQSGLHKNQRLGTGLQPWTPRQERITLCLVNRDDVNSVHSVTEPGESLVLLKGEENRQAWDMHCLWRI